MRWMLVLAMLAGPAAAQDADKGGRVFRKCMACHALGEGLNKNGPTLHGLIGKPVASEPRYAYSAALRAVGSAGGVWDEERLAEYLANPRAAVPGTKMIYPGLKSEEDIADIIAFLKEQE